jgi:hypothetical protein
MTAAIIVFPLLARPVVARGAVELIRLDIERTARALVPRQPVDAARQLSLGHSRGEGRPSGPDVGLMARRSRRAPLVASRWVQVCRCACVHCLAMRRR